MTVKFLRWESQATKLFVSERTLSIWFIQLRAQYALWYYNLHITNAKGVQMDFARCV